MTSTHISEDLPRLLTGDAGRDEVLAAAGHLRSCPDCQQELVSAVVAHASLTSAHRFAPEIVSPEATEHPVEHEVPVGQLPDMSSMFAKVRAEAATSPARPSHRRRWLVAAAAAVVLGGGTVAAVEVASSNSGPTQRTVALEPFGTGSTAHSAKVTIVGNGRMRIDATSLPKLNSTHFYQVWLTDDGRTKMYSAGPIGNDNTAELSVPSKVMSQYNDIEVSIQRTNQSKYSGISVVRGAYG